MVSEERKEELIKKARALGNAMILQNFETINSNLDDKAAEDVILEKSQNLIDDDFRSDKFPEALENVVKLKAELRRNEASGQLLRFQNHEILAKVKNSLEIIYFTIQLRQQLGTQIKSMRNKNKSRSLDISEALIKLGAINRDNSNIAKGSRPNARMSSSSSSSTPLAAALPPPPLPLAVRAPLPAPRVPVPAQTHLPSQSTGNSDPKFIQDYLKTLSESPHTTGSIGIADLSFMEGCFNLLTPETTKVAE